MKPIFRYPYFFATLAWKSRTIGPTTRHFLSIPHTFWRSEIAEYPRRLVCRRQRTIVFSYFTGSGLVDQFKQDFDAAVDSCWAADSWSVNPLDDDDVNNRVRCFNSPAPQAYFALQRAFHLENDTESVLRTFSHQLKKGFKFAVYADAPVSDTLKWAIFPDGTPLETGWRLVEVNGAYNSTLEIAHRLLELSTEASQRHETIDPKSQDFLVQLAERRLDMTLGTDIRGRASADAAFCFALAGITNVLLFDALATITKVELKRIGKRASFPSKDILHMVERFAASGHRSPKVDEVYTLAAGILRLRGEYSHVSNALTQTDEKSHGVRGIVHSS